MNKVLGETGGRTLKDSGAKGGKQKPMAFHLRLAQLGKLMKSMRQEVLQMRDIANLNEEVEFRKNLEAILQREYKQSGIQILNHSKIDAAYTAPDWSPISKGQWKRMKQSVAYAAKKKKALDFTAEGKLPQKPAPQKPKQVKPKPNATKAGRTWSSRSDYKQDSEPDSDAAASDEGSQSDSDDSDSNSSSSSSESSWSNSY